MRFEKDHIYQWKIENSIRQGKWTGEIDTCPGFEDNLIMKNEEGILWSISPQYIVKEIKQEKNKM